MEIHHILDFIRDVSLALAGTLLCNSLSCLQATSLRPDCASTDFLSLVSVFHWKRLPRAVFRSDNHAFDAWILCSRWDSLERPEVTGAKPPQTRGCFDRCAPAHCCAIVNF